MDAIGLIILAIIAIIAISALLKIIIAGKDEMIRQRNQIYSVIGLLILILTLALTMIFK